MSARPGAVIRPRQGLAITLTRAWPDTYRTREIGAMALQARAGTVALRLCVMPFQSTPAYIVRACGAFPRPQDIQDSGAALSAGPGQARANGALLPQLRIHAWA